MNYLPPSIFTVFLLCLGSGMLLTGGEPELRELPDKAWLVEQFNPIEPGQPGSDTDFYPVPEWYLKVPEVQAWLERHSYQDLWYHYMLADAAGDSPRTYIMRFNNDGSLPHLDELPAAVPFSAEDRSLVADFQPLLQEEWEIKGEMDAHTRYYYAHLVFFYQHYRKYLRGRSPNWIEDVMKRVGEFKDHPIIYSPINLRNPSGDFYLERSFVDDDWQIIREELASFGPEEQDLFYRRLLDQEDLGGKEFYARYSRYASTESFHRKPPSMRLFYVDLMYLSYRWKNGHIVLGEELQEQLQAKRAAKIPDFNQPLEHELGWYLRDGWPVPPITMVVEAMDNGLVDFSDSRAMAVGIESAYRSWSHLNREGREEWLDHSTIPAARFLLRALADRDISTGWHFRAVQSLAIMERYFSRAHRKWPDHRADEVTALLRDIAKVLGELADSRYDDFILETRGATRGQVSADSLRVFLDKNLGLIGQDGELKLSGELLCPAPKSRNLTTRERLGGKALFSLANVTPEGLRSSDYIQDRLDEIDRSWIIKRVRRYLKRLGDRLALDPVGQEHLHKWSQAHPELREVIAEILREDND